MSSQPPSKIVAADDDSRTAEQERAMSDQPAGKQLCESCERGDHANCGMQSWCQCDDERDGDNDAQTEAYWQDKQGDEYGSY